MPTPTPPFGTCFPISAWAAGPRHFIDKTAAEGDQIGVSAISLAEIVYLVEKGRVAPNALLDLCAALADPKAVLRHIPLDEAVALEMTRVSRLEIPDLPDRIIAATAQLRRIPVLSRDGKITSSTVVCIW